MYRIVIVVWLLSSALNLAAKEKDQLFKVELHGFIGVNAFYDTRQSVIARNGNIYLFPKKAELDANGKDIHAAGRFDIDAAFSRFGIHVKGPAILGAQSFALLEGDFLGDRDPSNDVNFRLRHAYLRLNWEKSSLLLGQYWHPLFLTENFPSTVNLSCGVVHHPLNRQPMVRFGHELGAKFELIAYLMSQNDFSDRGMSNGAAYALQPEFDLQMKFKNKKGVFVALTAGFKSLRPALYEVRDGKEYITRQKVNSAYVAGSFRKQFKAFTFKAEALYGGAMTNLVMLGGVAQKANESTEREYVPLRNLSVWSDIHTNHSKVQPGILLGYSKNLGAGEAAKIIPEYGFGADIGHLYSIAPRVRFYLSPRIWWGIECLHTVAAYGGGFDETARPINLSNVSNNRYTCSVRYTF